MSFNRVGESSSRSDRDPFRDSEPSSKPTLQSNPTFQSRDGQDDREMVEDDESLSEDDGLAEPVQVPSLVFPDSVISEPEPISYELDSDDSDEEWEYEYDEDEREDFHVVVDFTNVKLAGFVEKAFPARESGRGPDVDVETRVEKQGGKGKADEDEDEDEVGHEEEDDDEDEDDEDDDEDGVGSSSRRTKSRRTSRTGKGSRRRGTSGRSRRRRADDHDDYDDDEEIDSNDDDVDDEDEDEEDEDEDDDVAHTLPPKNIFGQSSVSASNENFKPDDSSRPDDGDGYIHDSTEPDLKKMQILGLGHRNPVIAFGGEAFACEWSSSIGTEMMFVKTSSVAGLSEQIQLQAGNSRLEDRQQKTGRDAIFDPAIRPDEDATRDVMMDIDPILMGQSTSSQSSPSDGNRKMGLPVIPLKDHALIATSSVRLIARPAKIKSRQNLIRMAIGPDGRVGSQAGPGAAGKRGVALAKSTAQLDFLNRLRQTMIQKGESGFVKYGTTLTSTTSNKSTKEPSRRDGGGERL